MALATTSVSGLVSGLDTASIIQQMMSIERRPISLLQDQMAKAEQQKGAFTTINTSLLALKTIADELAGESTWLEKTASVSDESILSATVSSDTLAGIYKFTVNQLATATQLSSNGYADSDTTAVGAGSFDLTVGGTTEAVTVNATDTLDDVASAINAKDMGVTAIVVNTGSGAQPYKLIVSSNDTGTTGEAVVSNNISGLAFTEITQAKNAIIQFGEDSPIVVESDTNTVTGLASGLTLDLKAVSASPVTVTVASDTTGIVEKAKDFATKYSAVQSNISKYTDYDVEGERAAILFGNSTLRFISSDLARAVGDSVAGIDAEVNSLTMVGFSLTSDGTLNFDEEVFKSAIEDNLDGVTELFSGVIDRALGSQGAAISGPAAEAGYDVNDLINGDTAQGDFGSGNGFLAANPIAGGDVFSIDLDSAFAIKQLAFNTMDDGTGVSDFTVKLFNGATEVYSDTAVGFSGSLWLDVLSDPLVATRMEITVNGTNAPDGKTRLLEIKATAEAGVGHVLSNQLDFITRGFDGAIANEQESLDNRISSYEDQIADLEERLLAKEARLRGEFIAMEMALQQMQSQANFFMSQLSQTPSSSK